MATNTLLFNSVDELLPHEGEIILLTEVLAWDDDWLEARVDHRKPSLFKQENGTVPAWVGLEYMAQTICALIGIHAKKAGEPIQIGFLMGTQKYETSVSEFAKDSVLTVRVDEIFTENNLALFDCSIRSDVVLAAAQIKAVRPEDLDSILEGI